MAIVSPSSSPATPRTRQSTTPRINGLRDHAALWFQPRRRPAGHGSAPTSSPRWSLPRALLAVVIGSALGAGLLAWVSAVGCREGLSSSALVGQALGRRLALLPVALNVLQLLGWAAFELVVMRDGTAAIVRQVTGSGRPGCRSSPRSPGARCCWCWQAPRWSAWCADSSSRFGAAAGGALAALAGWRFLDRAQARGLRAVGTAGDGSMSLLAAIDLVIAMPVSWLPLVADYARFGHAGGDAARGTWIGYTLANAWCYALGVLVVSTTEPGADNGHAAAGAGRAGRLGLI